MNRAPFAPTTVPTTACLLFALFCVQTLPAQEQKPDSGPTTTLNTVPVPPPEEGIGADQRSRVARAVTLVGQKKLDQASAEIDEVLAVFRKLTNDPDVIYVIVASQEELTQFRKAQKDRDRKVVWIDWAHGTALHTRAVIAVERKRPEEALALLEKLSAQAPFRADAWTERGYILNHGRKPAEGLKAYRKALDLAERYPAARGSRAVALRGIGYALIELGDLEGARTALKDSLKIEPNNRLAENELEYIRRLEERRKKKE